MLGMCACLICAKFKAGGAAGWFAAGQTYLIYINYVS